MRIFFVFAFIASFYLSHGQVGSYFPSVETETVKGETIQLPDFFQGKYTLIGVGTSKKAEDDLRTWQAPVYNKFVRKSGLMDEMYDVSICFLPLFTGASKVAKDKVVKKLRQNNESLVIDHVYIYAGSREPFNNIGIGDKAEPYFLLVDENGKIVWSASGKFKRRHFDAIEEILDQ